MWTLATRLTIFRRNLRLKRSRNGGGAPRQTCRHDNKEAFDESKRRGAPACGGPLVAEDTGKRPCWRIAVSASTPVTHPHPSLEYLRVPHLRLISPALFGCQNLAAPPRLSSETDSRFIGADFIGGYSAPSPLRSPSRPRSRAVCQHKIAVRLKAALRRVDGQRQLLGSGGAS